MDIFIFFRATAAAATAAVPWLVLEAEKPFVGYGTHLSCLHGLWLLITNNGAISIYNTQQQLFTNNPNCKTRKAFKRVHTRHKRIAHVKACYGERERERPYNTQTIGVTIYIYSPGHITFSFMCEQGT